MTPLITPNTFWTETLPGTWQDVSSLHLGPDLFSLLNPGGRASHRARSSWIGSLKVINIQIFPFFQFQDTIVVP